ncbi:HPr kinase/phosphorylase [Brevundimonas sp. FT23042]|uniref:HPr kinase/phosphorylase n=1 Tax=Brevundimonas sp. FT23042 TaxID=3393749 RepID=UPI003B588E22
MTAPSPTPVHLTVVAQWAPGRGWRAVAFQGRSGAGKSDLALRLVDRGWRLVADDYAHVFPSGGRLFARAPDAIRGRIEVRGVGIMPARELEIAPVLLAVTLTHEPVERLPEPETVVISGVRLPVLRLDPREASAGEKVAAMMARL